jgi:hypothetical protein
MGIGLGDLILKMNAEAHVRAHSLHALDQVLHSIYNSNQVELNNIGSSYVSVAASAVTQV